MNRLPPNQPELAAVLDYWFGQPADADFGQRRPFWFQSTPALDTAIRERFLAIYERADGRAYDHAAQNREACFALILLFDQLPRNMFRGEPRSFATDAKARTLAEAAITAGDDQAYLPLHRTFFYTPFEHSEHSADQERAVALFEALPPYELRERSIHMARRHRDIIARFGRFPHRNAILGRTTTPEEAAFLREPDSSFTYPRREDGTPDAAAWHAASRSRES
ncbi:MAG: DUF924 domain-containing protein [Alphaproteobacteria bacterium]|nr:DUF924 domain-containing protein [Alphaproteobacteria bacterium]